MDINVRQAGRLAITAVASALCVLISVFWIQATRQEVIDSAQFIGLFYGTLLTGESVIFALAFVNAGAWPSLRDIDSHIAFREWVLLGGLAATVAGCSLLTDHTTPATAGTLVWLVADLLGLFSFLRLFGLATATGRRRLLQATLSRRLRVVADKSNSAESVANLSIALRADVTLEGFRSAVDAAVARADGSGIRELVEEMAGVSVSQNTVDAAFAVQMDMVHRLTRAALLGRLDPVVAASALADLISSLLARHSNAPAVAVSGLGSHAIALGQVSRYLSWSNSCSLLLASRGIAPTATARELIRTALARRLDLVRLVDPALKNSASVNELDTPLLTPDDAVYWFRDFCEFQGSSTGTALYALYELLTGARYSGNYFDGDPILADLAAALFDTGSGRVETSAADVARDRFGTVANFNEIMTLVSVGTLATLRSAEWSHPDELVFPEFTPERRLLAAYIGAFARHSYLRSAEEGLAALSRALLGSRSALWRSISAADQSCDWRIPVARPSSSRRLGACVLSVTIRLRHDPAAGPVELNRFLSALPEAPQEAAAQLTQRILGHRSSRDSTPRASITEFSDLAWEVGRDFVS